jgi:hypothetical protein
VTDSEKDIESEIIIQKKVLIHKLLSIAIDRIEAALAWKTQTLLFQKIYPSSSQSS